MTPNEEKALEELVWVLTSPHTHEEIAERLGVSLITVKRIQASALEKMRLHVSDEEWVTGVREPPSLARRLNAVFSSDGIAPRDERE